MPGRRTGYLACIDNVPPLIFRFQFNPDSLTEKKSFKYAEANSFGSWTFDQKRAASGFFGRIGGAIKDANEIGALLVATKPLEADGGEQRTFSLEFSLDATTLGPLDGSQHYGGSIEPDLAVLRSFVNPAWDVFDAGQLIGSGFKKVACWSKPPTCSLMYGGLSVTCVMTDLSIKMVAFFDDGTPSRAEVSVTLKQQTYSTSPLIEFIDRLTGVARSYGRRGFGDDVIAVTPQRSIAGLFR